MKSACLNSTRVMLGALASLFVIPGLACAAQSAAPAGNARTNSSLAFEVASIRKSAPEVRRRATSFLMPQGNLQPQSGLLSANEYLSTYVEFAYNIVDIGLAGEMSKTLPNWAGGGMWDIEARANGIPTRDQMRIMMQSLLKERFKLKVHYETRRLPVSVLTLAKPGKLGPGLQVHPANLPCKDPKGASSSASGNAQPCGTKTWFDEAGHVHSTMISASMEEFAGLLGGLDQGRPIVNRTGLKGLYDTRMDYILTPPPGMQISVSGQTLDEALVKQLGLKLVMDVLPVQILVVDHVEKPSPN